MIIDVPSSQIWSTTNQTIKEIWSTDSITRIFPNLTLAIYETLVGMAQFYAHKRSVTYIKGHSPYIPFATNYFYKEAYSVQLKEFALGLIPNGSPEAFSTQVTAALADFEKDLKKDQLFVFAPLENPLTSEIQNFDLLRPLLTDKKIPLVLLSYQPSTKWKPASNEIILQVFPSKKVLALFGEKIKIPTLIAANFPWSSTMATNFIQEVKTVADICNNKTDTHDNGTSQNAHFILQLESKLPAPLKPFHLSVTFTPQNRLFDKAIIDAGTINADFLKSNLEIQLKKHPHFSHLLSNDTDTNNGIQITKTIRSDIEIGSPIETSNLCRWHEREGFYDWYPFGKIDNLLFISSSLLTSNESVLAMLDMLNTASQEATIQWTLPAVSQQQT